MSAAVEPSIVAAVHERAALEDRSASSIVRQALKAWLAQPADQSARRGRAMTAVEHPTDAQIDALRQAGWTIVSTLSGLKATRPDAGGMPWAEALELDAAKQER